MAERLKDQTGLSGRAWLIALPLTFFAGWIVSELALTGGPF